jgi:hypothetical protein
MRSLLGILFGLILWISGLSAVAQPNSNASWNDPLKKPALWSKLRGKPNDSTLWVQYMGKDWKEMTPKDKEKVAVMRQELYIQWIANQESIVGEQNKTAENDLFQGYANPPSAVKQNNILNAVEAKQLADIEKIILQEREDVKNLKNNVYENFVILEDAYKEIYEDFGVEYKFYKDVYPNNEYSELKWIEEQETRIKQLKLKKIEELKKQFTITK